MKNENESIGDTNLIIVEPNNKNEEIIESSSFILQMKDISYSITLCKTKVCIIFISQNYELKLSLKEFIYTNNLFNVCRNIDEIYKLFLTLFNKKKIRIKEIKENQILILEITLKNYIDEEESITNLILLYKSQNKDFIINNIYNKYHSLKSEMDKIKFDYNRMNNKLNKAIYEINKIKEDINFTDANSNRSSNISNAPSLFSSNKKFEIEPTSLNSVYNLVNDSYNIDYLDNTFTLYSSKNDCLYLIYATENKAIKCYSFGQQKIIKDIKNAHDDYITNFRHCFNKKLDKDLIMSISGWINNIKIWDGNSWNCLLNITNVNNNGYLFSSAFLVIKNFVPNLISNSNKLTEEYYIISSNRNHMGSSEHIKIFDLNGKLISKFPESNDNTCFIDTFCEKEKSGNKENLKYYIITGNTGYVKAYDYFKKKLFLKYQEKENKSDHLCVVIKKLDDVIKLIESCADGFIRIWGFHSGELIGKIECKNGLLGICVWNGDYLFTGCKDNSIKLIDIKNLKIVKSLTGHNNFVCTIRKIVHPKYGGCIITQSWHNDDIKIWMNNSLNNSSQ